MDIKRFFEGKKRDLSSQSDDGDDAKRQRENKEAESPTSLLFQNEVFKEGLESEDCVKILCNCMKNMETEMKRLFSLVETSKESQIKGESQLTELNKAVSYINDRFDEYERERKEKGKIIKELKEDIPSMKGNIERLEKDMESQAQNSRKNCVLINGIEEKLDEDTE